jgi:serine/threonine protein kinase
MDVPPFIGRYKVLERVARGTMGVVYRAHDPTLDREVAVKVMFGIDAENETARQRFYRDARAAARLQHPNIVTVFEFADHDGMPYIVMEFLRGMSLANRLRGDRPLSLLETIDIIRQLCCGLEFAHDNGVVHRGVKPANIWLCADGTVKLLDFGIAKSDQSAVTALDDLIGGPAYMSPEQIAGPGVDRRTDIFSVGAVLYELLTGHNPFEGESPTAVMMKIVNDPMPPIALEPTRCPAALVSIVKRALEKRPDDRYQRAAEMRADLDAVKGIAAPKTAELPPITRSDTNVRQRLELDARGSRSRWATLGEFARRPSFRWVAVVAVVVTVLAGARVWSSRRVETGEATVATGTQPKDSPPVRNAPAFVTFRVSSAPADAAIFLDDRDSGLVTPADVKVERDRLPARVRLSKRGYQSSDIPIDARVLSAGIDRELVRVSETATIRFFGDYPFELLDGARVLQSAATMHELKITERRAIRMRASTVYLDQTVTVDPAEGRRDVVVPRIVTLIIRTVPAYENCLLSIANHPPEALPLTVPVIVEGPQDVVLTCRDGRTLQRRIQVVRGRPTEIIQ